MKTLIALIAITSLLGCAELMKMQDKSAEEVARLIVQYCESTDQDFRDSIREDINENAAPHSIMVTCVE